jgi:site-specific DNA-cytosine methylase
MVKTATRKRKQPRAARRKSAWEMVPLTSWHDAHYHVHYMMETKDWLNQIKGYVKKNYDKKIQQAINNLPDWKVGNKSHYATAAFVEENKPEILHHDYVGKLDKWINELAAEGKKVVTLKAAETKTKKNVYVPSIQERLMETTIDKMEELEQWIDDWMRNPKQNPLSNKQPITLFRKLEINLGHARFIQKFYEGAYEELTELINLPTKNNQDDMQQQLAEGYNHLSKAEQKELHGFYQRIFQALDIVRAEKKQTRVVRKPKQKSAQELVKKFKFKSSDVDMSIASVNPVEIIGATALVVFNCKNRKLGIYHAEDNCTFQIKGTTLQFFDEARSVQKTIRKPQEILPHWKKVTKHKLATQFDYLKTTETKLNGRFNEDTIILRVFK